jgi:hypothetical protein
MIFIIMDLGDLTKIMLRFIFLKYYLCICSSKVIIILILTMTLFEDIHLKAIFQSNVWDSGVKI